MGSGVVKWGSMPIFLSKVLGFGSTSGCVALLLSKDTRQQLCWSADPSLLMRIVADRDAVWDISCWNWCGVKASFTHAVASQSRLWVCLPCDCVCACILCHVYCNLKLLSPVPFWMSELITLIDLLRMSWENLINRCRIGAVWSTCWDQTEQNHWTRTFPLTYFPVHWIVVIEARGVSFTFFATSFS